MKLVWLAKSVEYLFALALLVLGLIELVLRATVMLLAIPATFWAGFFIYVDNHPADFKDLMTPVCFRLAERIVSS